jgi:predicted RecA/RadA family phage recombinase
MVNHGTQFCSARRDCNPAAPSPGVSSGDGVLVGGLFGIANFDAATGADCEVTLEGVWTLPKAGTPLAFQQGAAVYWDSAAKLCKASATGFYKIGVAILAATANDTHVTVRLDGVSVSAVPGT